MAQIGRLLSQRTGVLLTAFARRATPQFVFKRCSSSDASDFFKNRSEFDRVLEESFPDDVTTGNHAYIRSNSPEPEDWELSSYFPEIKISEKATNRFIPNKHFVYMLVDQTHYEKILEEFQLEQYENNHRFPRQLRKLQLLDTILYFGEAQRPDVRLVQHRKGKEWEENSTKMLIKEKEKLQMIIVDCFEGANCLSNALLAESILIESFGPYCKNNLSVHVGRPGSRAIRTPTDEDFNRVKRSLIRALASEPDYVTLDTLKCLECDATESSSCWIQYQDGLICKSCYNRMLYREPKKGNCARCSAVGYRSYAGVQYCKSCYLLMRDCAICSKTESPKWYNYDKEEGKKICEGCYQKQRYLKLKNGS